jgi:hypothetical protein
MDMNTQYVCYPQPQPQPQHFAYAQPIYQAASTASFPPASFPPAKAEAAPNEYPNQRAGMNYMWPAEHTKLHIFNKSSKIWEDKYVGKPL